MYDYSAAAWLMLFYIYCFCGWVFECIVVSVQERKPINRGFLRGPMLPIYGFGAVMMLHIALPLAGQPIPLFFSGMAAATAFEYVVGVGMEAIFKVKYWDYSAHRFQFQGRICLQSTIAWGVLSVALVYLIHPPIAYLLQEFNPLPLLFTVLVLSVYFIIDAAASVKTALDFTKLLEELAAMRENVRVMRTELSANAAEAKEKLSDAACDVRGQLSAAAYEGRERLTVTAAEMKEQLSGAAVEGRERLSDAAGHARQQLNAAIAEAEHQIESKIKNMTRSRKGLVRGNPTLRSARFSEILREIRQHLK